MNHKAVSGFWRPDEKKSKRKSERTGHRSTVRSILFGPLSTEVFERAEIGLDRLPPPHKEVTYPMKSPTWYTQARCKGIDPEIFYPIADEEGDEAKAICAECPVRLQCLETALANRERDGIWGGATEKERRRIIRQRRKTA
jgi:WhiB family transcriptional regulator, redox-sensing transcriptional regulator